MSRIVLLTDDSLNVNWGAWAMKEALDAMLSARLPDTERRWLTRGWLQKGHRALTVKGMRGVIVDPLRFPRPLPRFLYRLSAEIEEFPLIYDEFEPFGDAWERGPVGPISEAFLRAMRNADAVVFNGEGHIQSNREVGMRALFLLWYAKTRLGKPALAIDHTTHLADMARPIMATVVRHLYPRLDGVAVREPRSAEDLAAIGVTKVQTIPDVVFTLTPDAEANSGADRWLRDAGLQPRSYFCVSAGDLPMDWPSGDAPGRLVSLLNELNERTGKRPLVFGKDKRWQLMEDVAHRAGAAVYGRNHDNAFMWRILENAAFTISGHYHHLVACATVGCPFIPLRTDTSKIESFLGMLQWDSTAVHDPTDLTHESVEIVREVAGLLRDRDTISASLKACAKQLASASMATADLVADSLGG